MKCPKCGYLGFETSERCRNCGYDFSLAVDLGPAAELPLHSSEGAGEPLADFDLSGLDTFPEEPRHTSGLDLDRLIGSPEPDPTPQSPAVRTAPRARSAPTPSSAGLPLFNDGEDDTPLITVPRPVRPPLSVRRTTPEIPRTRARVVTPRPEDGELALPIETPTVRPAPAVATAAQSKAVDLAPAAAGRRLTATLIDLGLLVGIDVAVVYLTLALAGLTLEQMSVLPMLPIAAFFAILDGGYLVAFIAASGQTIGKMVTGIRVVGDDGGKVDIAAAMLRAAGCGVSLLTAGLGYLPAFLTAERRALQDRISGSRVVSAR